MLNAAKKYARNKIIELIKDGGELVEKAEYERRKSICDKCERKGTVRVLGLYFEGCTACGCPFETKLWMKRVVDKIHQTVLGVEEVFCPHPDGDKWQEDKTQTT